MKLDNFVLQIKDHIYSPDELEDPDEELLINLASEKLKFDLILIDFGLATKLKDLDNIDLPQDTINAGCE